MAFNLFGFKTSSTNEELPDIFPFATIERDFVQNDVVNIYARILTDVLERTEGIKDENLPLLWDNCLANESQDGLVTMIAKAMYQKSELYLIYNAALKVIVKATPEEEAQIRADYKARGESSLGVYVTFKNYARTDMVKMYSCLEYATVCSLSKSMNLSKAIQIKLTDLRASVALADSDQVKTQGTSIARGLACGKDIMLDAKDVIETAKPDLTATQSSMDFIAQKRSFYLGMPASYITGQAPKGLGDTGEGDQKATERGLKGYYFSTVKPVIEALFKVKTTFKSEDFNGMNTKLETLRTFELVSDELMSQENKLGIINKLFGFPDGTKGDEPEEPIEPPPTEAPKKKSTGFVDIGE